MVSGEIYAKLDDVDAYLATMKFDKPVGRAEICEGRGF